MDVQAAVFHWGVMGKLVNTRTRSLLPAFADGQSWQFTGSQKSTAPLEGQCFQSCADQVACGGKSIMAGADHNRVK